MDYCDWFADRGTERVQHKPDYNAHADTRANTDAMDYLRTDHCDARTGNGEIAAHNHAAPAGANADTSAGSKTDCNTTTSRTAIARCGCTIAHNGTSVLAWHRDTHIPRKWRAAH